MFGPVFWLMCALGVGQHFLFVPLGRPRWLCWLLPVSESPWEHCKLVFWPLGLGLGAVGYGLGCTLNGFLLSWLCAGAHAVAVMLSIYYFYRAALGVSRPVLWIDIGNFFVTMLCAWPIGLGLLQRTPGPVPGCLCALVLTALAQLFDRAARRPPVRYPMFREENTNGRDQRTGST